MRSERLFHLRDALSDPLADAPCRRIRRAVGPDVAEGLNDILGASRQVGGQTANAAPSVLQGAAAGFLAGGPAGAVVGGTLGALGAAGVKPSAGAGADAAAPAP